MLLTYIILTIDQYVLKFCIGGSLKSPKYNL